jgi:hypothetical protein
MPGKPHIGGCVVKGGLLFGGLIFVSLMAVETAFPAVGKCLSAPAMGLANVWHGIGLPPRGEAAVMLPFLSMVVECLVLGGLIGLWRYSMLRRKYGASSAGNPGGPPVT